MAAIYLTAFSSSLTTRRRPPPRKERVTPSSGHSTVSRTRSDHHHPTVGDLGSDRSKSRSRSRSRSKTQSSSLRSRTSTLVVPVLTGLHFAFCIENPKRVPSTGPPAASRPSVHIKPAPAAARALSDAPTLQNVPIIHIAHWTRANSPHPFACRPVESNLGQGDPSKSSPKRSGSPRRLEKPSSSPSRLFIPESSHL